MGEEENPNHWDTHDSTEIFETAEKVKLKINRPDDSCPHCGFSRLRRRMIDLSVLENTISFKKTKVIYCPSCKISKIPEESLKELVGRLGQLGAKIDTNIFSTIVREELKLQR